MSKFRRAILWAVLALIILLIFLSIYGAFIGAERAQEFFNRIPLAVYWAVFGLALIIGLAAFRRLIRVPGLLLLHTGCILILAGAMWSSQIGHELQNRFFGTDRIPKGRMAIYEGESENQVTVDDGQQPKELPFSIKLKDFRIEYYEPAYLEIGTSEGQNLRVAAEVGKELDLGDQLGTAKIVKTFENFKMAIEDGKSIAYEDPHPGSNPALEVQITQPDGQVTTQYLFSLFPGHSHSQSELQLKYNRPANRAISDYISELQIIENDKVVAEKDIEVNHPLHYAGYHFYQHSYDSKAGRYTVLQVVSDTGIAVVFAGYWMLCVGVIWHLWLRHIFKRIGSRSK